MLEKNIITPTPCNGTKLSKGIFVISFDCEGKWGFSDKNTREIDTIITNENLIKTYKQLIKILKKYEIIATFAYVGALTLSVKEFRENKNLFSPRIYNGVNWLKLFFNQFNSGNVEGWLCPELFDLTHDSCHEQATHGFCHVPFSEENISIVDIKKEFHAINTWRKIKGVGAYTFIYPRNVDGFKGELAKNGIVGYRISKAKDYSKFQRAWSLFNELDMFTTSQEKVIDEQESIIKIPGGYFLNWRFGGRRYIPISLTVKRWKNMIDHAAEHKGIVHLYSHPHNFINGKDQFLLFDQIVQYASKRVKDGSIVNLTQEQYCKSVISY